MSDNAKFADSITYLVTPTKLYQNWSKNFDPEISPGTRTNILQRLSPALQFLRGIPSLVDGQPIGPIVIPFKKVNEALSTDTGLHGGDGIVISVSSNYSIRQIEDALNKSFASIGRVFVFRFTPEVANAPSRPDSLSSSPVKDVPSQP